MIATRHGGTAVRQGDALCGTRVIPLVIAEETLARAEAIAMRPLAQGAQPGRGVVLVDHAGGHFPDVQALLAHAQQHRDVLLPDHVTLAPGHGGGPAGPGRGAGGA